MTENFQEPLVTENFQEQIFALEIDRDLAIQIQSLLIASNKAAFSRYTAKNSTMEFPSERSLDYLIQRLTEKSLSIQENIRKKQLKNAEVMKNSLESKLQHISKSIDNLKVHEKSQNLKKKFNLQQKESRQEFYEEEKHKAQTAAEKIQKFSEITNHTQEVLKNQSEKLKKIVEEVNEQERMQIEAEQKRKEQLRISELEKMRMKKEERIKEKEILSRIQSESGLHIDKKPLYIKIEEKYKINVEMPELEKRKEELKKKSLFFSPIHKDEIRDHIKKYQSVKHRNEETFKKKLNNQLIESQMRFSSLVSSLKSPNIWKLRLIEEEKEQEEEEYRKINEKKRLIVKQKKYAELIKELHTPTFVKKKADLNEQVKKKSKSTLSKHDLNNSSVWKPHSFPVNTMVPQPKPKRAPKPILYLEEKRIERDNKPVTDNPELIEKIIENNLHSGNYSTKTMKKLQENAIKLEEIARKKEILLDPNVSSVKAIKKAASVDKLIISSIKAKLHVIENLEEIG